MTRPRVCLLIITSWTRLLFDVGVGGPAACKEAAKRCTEMKRTVGPTLSNGVGGPAACKEAAKRCTEMKRTVGPTLINKEDECDASSSSSVA